MEIPFALAFGAGLVAMVNPCGFAMLPAYLSYFMGLEDGGSSAGTASGVLRGLRVGAVVSAGFLAVFGLAGVLITLGVQAVIGIMPWAAMVVGVGVAALGVALLAGYELTASLPKIGKAGNDRGLGGVFVFGVSYAVASLSCTLPIFLVVVAGTIPQLGFVAGVATFLVYGLGMSTLLLAVTLALAFGRQAVIGRLRRASQYVNRIAGGILVVAGGYIVLFWTTTLAGDGVTQATPVVWVERLSSTATNWLSARADAIGLTALAVVLAIVAAVSLRGLVRRWTARRRSRPDDAAPQDRDRDAAAGSRR